MFEVKLNKPSVVATQGSSPVPPHAGKPLPPVSEIGPTALVPSYPVSNVLLMRPKPVIESRTGLPPTWSSLPNRTSPLAGIVHNAD